MKHRIDSVKLQAGEACAVHEFRVTKYDPALRNASGAFTGDEWTSYDDIDETFSGVTLTEATYRRVEDAYVAAATSFMREAGVTSLVVAGLENAGGVRLTFGESSALDLESVGDVLRRILGGDCWCRLEAADGFVHIGWDYYMYIGVGRPCPSAEAETRRLGLFVEPVASPHRERADA